MIISRTALFALCALVPLVSFAQTTTDDRLENGNGPVFRELAETLFFTAGVGLAGHDNGPFSRRLQSYHPLDASGHRMLYQTDNIPNVGWSVSGAFGAQIGTSLMLGISGEFLFFNDFFSRNPPGEPQDAYRLGGRGAGVDLGLIVVNEDATLVYPFLHAGYYGYRLQYVNNHSFAIPFFEGQPVPAMSTASFDGAAPRVALGIGLLSFLFGHEVIGARLSYGQMLGRPEWRQNGDVVNNGGHTPAWNALTLTLYVGMGMTRYVR